jgi:hypothetical protein
MDPGNWATDIAGGAKFGYTLLSVVMLSSLVAMFLQHMALKLGVATNRDLAQCCRDAYWHPVNIALWILAEVGGFGYWALADARRVYRSHTAMICNAYSAKRSCTVHMLTIWHAISTTSHPYFQLTLASSMLNTCA